MDSFSSITDLITHSQTLAHAGNTSAALHSAHQALEQATALGDAQVLSAAVDIAKTISQPKHTAPLLHVVTLGRFQVHQGVRRVTPGAWDEQRAGELFRLLLVSPGYALSHDQVLQALCPDRPGPAAQSTVDEAVAALRRAMGADLPEAADTSYIQVAPDQFGLNLPAGSWVDFEAFEQHIRLNEWEEALELYQGDLFPHDRFARWVTAPRERLLRMHLRAMLSLAQHSLEVEHPERALELCRRILSIEKWQEEAVLIGMKACLALNDRAEAIRLYHNLEYVLRQEIEIAPQEELRWLYTSLLDN